MGWGFLLGAFALFVGAFIVSAAGGHAVAKGDSAGVKGGIIFTIILGIPAAALLFAAGAILGGQ